MTPAAAPGTTAPRAALRWAALAALLWAEAVAVVDRYGWSLGVGNPQFLTKIGLAVAVAAAVFAGDRAARAAAALDRRFGRVRFPWAVAAAQLAAYALFVRFTSAVSAGATGGWVAGWVGAGVLAGGVWAWAVLPFRGWAVLLRRGWPGLVLGAAGGAAAWATAKASERTWDGLAGLTLAAVKVCLGGLFSAVEVGPGPTDIGADGFVVSIGPPCSGYEGFGLVLAVTGCYLWLCRDALRFPAALLLLPVGLAASWVLNVGRITALIALGAGGWPGVAVGGFHSQAGWLAFNTVALGVLLLGRLPPFRRAAGPRPGPRPENPAAPYLVPFMTVLGVGMVTAALTADGPNRLYAAQAVAGGFAVYHYRRHYLWGGWAGPWVAVGVGGAVFGVWLGLALLFPTEGATDTLGDLATAPAAERFAWFAARVIGAVVVVPVAEELAFRGYLLAVLSGAAPGRPPGWNWFAAVATSAAFAALHPGHVAAAAAAGMAYAWVFARRGRLSDAILAHAVSNGLLAVYVLATGRWSLW